MFISLISGSARAAMADLPVGTIRTGGGALEMGFHYDRFAQLEAFTRRQTPASWYASVCDVLRGINAPFPDEWKDEEKQRTIIYPAIMRLFGVERSFNDSLSSAAEPARMSVAEAWADFKAGGNPSLRSHMRVKMDGMTEPVFAGFCEAWKHATRPPPELGWSSFTPDCWSSSDSMPALEVDRPLSPLPSRNRRRRLRVPIEEDGSVGEITVEDTRQVRPRLATLPPLDLTVDDDATAIPRRRRVRTTARMSTGPHPDDRSGSVATFLGGEHKLARSLIEAADVSIRARFVDGGGDDSKRSSQVAVPPSYSVIVGSSAAAQPAEEATEEKAVAAAVPEALTEETSKRIQDLMADMNMKDIYEDWTRPIPVIDQKAPLIPRKWFTVLLDGFFKENLRTYAYSPYLRQPYPGIISVRTTMQTVIGKHGSLFAAFLEATCADFNQPIREVDDYLERRYDRLGYPTGYVGDIKYLKAAAPIEYSDLVKGVQSREFANHMYSVQQQLTDFLALRAYNCPLKWLLGIGQSLTTRPLISINPDGDGILDDLVNITLAVHRVGTGAPSPIPIGSALSSKIEVLSNRCLRQAPVSMLTLIPHLYRCTLMLFILGTQWNPSPSVRVSLMQAITEAFAVYAFVARNHPGDPSRASLDERTPSVAMMELFVAFGFRVLYRGDEAPHPMTQTITFVEQISQGGVPHPVQSTLAWHNRDPASRRSRSALRLDEGLMYIDGKEGEEVQCARIEEKSGKVVMYYSVFQPVAPLNPLTLIRRHTTAPDDRDPNTVALIEESLRLHPISFPPKE